MYGGILKRGTDFGSLHLRALSNYAKNVCVSFGAVSIDVKAAFESVLMCLVFGRVPSDEAIAHVSSRLFFKRCFSGFCGCGVWVFFLP